MANHSTYTLEIEASGEWIAEVEVICHAGDPGDFWTPGESGYWEIEQGEVRFLDEDGEKLLPESHGLEILSKNDMVYLNQQIDEQFANLVVDAEEYHQEYEYEDRLEAGFY